MAFTAGDAVAGTAAPRGSRGRDNVEVRKRKVADRPEGRQVAAADVRGDLYRLARIVVEREGAELGAVAVFGRLGRGGA
jgi:hypothetical protein